MHLAAGKAWYDRMVARVGQMMAAKNNWPEPMGGSASD
jgi:hypothetical protein